MNETSWLWVIFGSALVLDLISSAAKSAFTHVRLPHLLGIREKDPVRVDRTVDLFQKKGLRTALRLGLIFQHFMLAASAVLIMRQIFGLQKIWMVLLILIAVLLIITILEFLIERSILTAPEKLAVHWAGAAQAIVFFFAPMTNLMQAILGEQAEKVTLTFTDEDLRDWVELDQTEGTLEKGERQMIYSIFRFGETMTKEIMIPRMDVLALDINTSISDARQEFINAGHSRVPVYDDTIDNVVGLLYAKDLLAVVDGSDTIAAQRRLLRPAYFVPEAKKVDDLLTEMQSRGIHMAVVVDEYGGIAGVVTLEDIVEEIVGEIRDEYDQGEENLFEETAQGEYIFLGRATIDEFNEISGASLSDEFADTIGGFIYGQLGRVPQPGEVVESGPVLFTVEEVVARRILKVSVKINQDALETQEENHGHTR